MIKKGSVIEMFGLGETKQFVVVKDCDHPLKVEVVDGKITVENCEPRIIEDKNIEHAPYNRQRYR